MFDAVGHKNALKISMKEVAQKSKISVNECVCVVYYHVQYR